MDASLAQGGQPSQPNGQPEIDADYGGDDGEFYAQLVRQGKSWIEPICRLGRDILNEAVGDLSFGIAALPLTSVDDQAKDIKRPVSIYQRVLDTYLPAISPNELEVSVKPEREDARFEATVQSVRAKQLLKEIQFEDTDRFAAVQSLATGYGVWFTLPESFGIFGLLNNGDADPGRAVTWAVSVTDGDFICDPAARRRQEDRFRAVRIRFSKRAAIRLGLMTKEQAAMCEQLTDTKTNQDTCDLIAMWVVVVYEPGGLRWGLLYDSSKSDWFIPLEEWTGEANGPIEVAALKPFRVANRAVSPLHQLADLHKAMARLTESIIRRGINEKTVIAGDAMTQEFKEDVVNAEHLDFVHGTNVSMLNIGGLTPGQVNLLPILTDQINNSSANLQQSSGNGGISKTAREAMLLQSNANAILADMSDAFKQSRNRVLRQVMFYDFYIRQADQGVSVSIPINTSTGSVLQDVNIAPEDREADFFDLTFEITSNQARKLDPAVKLDLLTQLGAQLPQMIAGIMQLGGNPDPFIRDMAEFSGLSGLLEMFPTGSAQAIMQAKMQEAGAAAQQGQAKAGGAQAQPPGAAPPNELAGMGPITPLGAGQNAGAAGGKGGAYANT